MGAELAAAKTGAAPPMMKMVWGWREWGVERERCGELVRGAVTGVPYEAPARFCAHHSPAPQGRKPRGAAMPLETASLRAPRNKAARQAASVASRPHKQKRGRARAPLRSAAGETSKSARPAQQSASMQVQSLGRPRGASYPSRLVGAPPGLSSQLRVPGRCRGQAPGCSAGRAVLAMCASRGRQDSTERRRAAAPPSHDGSC